MRSCEAAGPDETTPALIKDLGENAKIALLTLHSESWNRAEITKDHWNATIIPCSRLERTLTKWTRRGRPISLTYYLAKVIERFIAPMLGHLIKNRDP